MAWGSAGALVVRATKAANVRSLGIGLIALALTQQVAGDRAEKPYNRCDLLRRIGAGDYQQCPDNENDDHVEAHHQRARTIGPDQPQEKAECNQAKDEDYQRKLDLTPGKEAAGLAQLGSRTRRDLRRILDGKIVQR